MNGVRGGAEDGGLAPRPQAKPPTKKLRGGWSGA